jgi:3-deoxy-7-phosphoheptulonate synthase
VDPSASCVALLEPGATEPEVAEVLAAAVELLPGAQVTRGDGWAAVPLGDGVRPVESDRFERLPSVRRLVQISAPFRLASRELFGEGVGIEVPIRNGALREEERVVLGGRAPLGVIVSSRWASGSEARLQLLAPLLRDGGCRIFHAGQVALAGDRDGSTGLPLERLRRLGDVAHEHGLALCVEVGDASQIAPAAEVADLLQVGSRNMQDFSLLREMGGTEHPVLLRRGVGATVEEFLLAAEYVLLHGNGKVILCESGIRTFDAVHKPRFEINAVPVIKQLSHLPLVADPSQTAPHAATVPAMAKAAIAAGADGVILEVGTEAGYDPDGVAIDIEAMQRLVAEARPIARAVGRSVATYGVEEALSPTDTAAVLRITDRTLAQTIETLTGAAPQLDVLKQWRLAPPVPSLSPPLSADGEMLARCTGYRMGSVRLSYNLSYVDLKRIDPTIGALLEAKHLNLGQLFVDPRIEKREFEFGADDTAEDIDEVFRRCFAAELDPMHPYVWRRYQAAIDGVVTFLVIEALPVSVWERILDPDRAMAPQEGSG